MIEIKYDDHKVALNLYNKIKDIILSKKGNPSFNYIKEQHHLYEEREHPGISKDYYNESGVVEYINSQGEMIILQISRWHPHKHNGCSGLNSWPCLIASVYLKKGEEKEVLWELKVKVGTMTYKAEATSLEIPNYLLEEKLDEKIEESVALENTGSNDNKQSKVEFNLAQIQKNIEYNYNTALQEKEELLQEREKAIAKAMESIREKYAECLEECDKKITEAQNKRKYYNDLIVKYSTFDDMLIGGIIKELINIVEGRSFEFQVAPYNKIVLRHGIWGGQGYEETILKRVKIMVSTENKKSEYQEPWDKESEVIDLVNRGEAILLNDPNKYIRDNHEITFYTVKDGQISCAVNYGRFDYIKEFIDYVIEHRFQNTLETVTREDILFCLQEFIKQNRNRIAENYISRINTDISMLTRQKN